MEHHSEIEFEVEIDSHSSLSVITSVYVLCLVLFFQESAIEYYDSKADSDYVSDISVLCFSEIVASFLHSDLCEMCKLQGCKDTAGMIEKSQKVDCFFLKNWKS